jgi:hypothetical protein
LGHRQFKEALLDDGSQNNDKSKEKCDDSANLGAVQGSVLEFAIILFAIASTSFTRLKKSQGAFRQIESVVIKIVVIMIFTKFKELAARDKKNVADDCKER